MLVPVMFTALIDSETDRQRFMRLYENNKDAMFFCAVRILGDEMLAEDAVQEAFLRVARGIGRIRADERSRALMLTITRNAALTIKKKNSRETPAADPGAFAARYADGHAHGSYASVSGNTTEDRLTPRLERERIADKLAEMPEIYSEVFVLRYAHELSFREIASLLGISAPAARKRAQRAREMIRAAMEDNSDEHGD